MRVEQPHISPLKQLVQYRKVPEPETRLTYLAIAVDVDGFDAGLDFSLLRVVILLVRVLFKRYSVDELATSLII